MIMILLNISYIPDEVAKQINFKPGWQQKFKQHMEEYKKQFYANTGIQWQFQNKKLEDDYADFMHSQEATDPDAIKEKATDDINAGFKNFFQRVQDQRKEALQEAENYNKALLGGNSIN